MLLSFWSSGNFPLCSSVRSAKPLVICGAYPIRVLSSAPLWVADTACLSLLTKTQLSPAFTKLTADFCWNSSLSCRGPSNICTLFCYVAVMAPTVSHIGPQVQLSVSQIQWPLDHNHTGATTSSQMSADTGLQRPTSMIFSICRRTNCSAWAFYKVTGSYTENSGFIGKHVTVRERNSILFLKENFLKP